MHLIDVLGPVDAPPDEDAAGTVEDRGGDTGPVGE
jgi:hypothetical protein